MDASGYFANCIFATSCYNRIYMADSKRKQFNVRPDDETSELIPLLIQAIDEATGLKITNSDLLRLGMKELAEKYLPDWKPKKPKK
jgi:hypothetical protein